MKQLHFIQLNILKKLLFSDGLRYSQMKPSKDIENNQYDFHLKELLRHALIEKKGNIYILSDKGKEYANRMDDQKVQIQRQAKVGAISVALREVSGEWEYLVYTRLKQPFYGAQGFPSGKVQWGELFSEASKREFKEETNLEGEPELYKIRHYVVFKKDTKELVEDKVFFFHRIVNPTGDLESNNEGKFEWVKESELEKYLTKPFDSAQEVIDHAIEARDFDGRITFHERHEYTDNF